MNSRFWLFWNYWKLQNLAITSRLLHKIYFSTLETSIHQPKVGYQICIFLCQVQTFTMTWIWRFKFPSKLIMSSIGQTELFRTNVFFVVYLSVYNFYLFFNVCFWVLTYMSRQYARHIAHQIAYRQYAGIQMGIESEKC